jgi:hypothetical protein
MGKKFEHLLDVKEGKRFNNNNNKYHNQAYAGTTE